VRTLTAQETKVLAAADGYTTRLRVKVKDGSGTFRDMTSLEGYDFLEGASWEESLDQPVAQCTVSLKREVELLSLAPQHRTSKLNLVAGSYNPLLKPGREFYVEVATLPLDVDAASGDWREVFRGDIDEIDAAKDVLTVTGRDLGGRLQDKFIETQTTYSDATGVAVETVMQDILDDNSTGVTLYVPTSPGWVIKQFSQKREPVLDALRALAAQIGWDVRYKWRSGTSQFELHFFEPDRTKVAIDYTWDSSKYREVGAFRSTRADVRNKIEVVFSDSTALTWERPRVTVTASDATSQAAYGLRYMQIQEASSSQIDTSTEAQAMADAALADLKDPVIEQEIETEAFYAVELGDLLRFTANSVHATSDLDLAVYGFRQEFGSDGDARTTIRTRGKPCSGIDWLSMDARPSVGGIVPLVGPDAPTGLSVTTTIKGFSLTFTPPIYGPKWDAFELHVSGSSGFTPDSSTFKAMTSTTRFDVNDLSPGVTYYVKVVPRDAKGNRGTASAEQTLSPRYVEPRNAMPGIAWDSLIHNPDFESISDTSVGPDGWEMFAGTWGTNIVSTTSAYSGTNAIILKGVGGSDAGILSRNVPVRPGDTINVSVWVKLTAGIALGGLAYAQVTFTDVTLTSTGTLTLDFQPLASGSWLKVTGSGTVPANSRWVDLWLYRGTTVSALVDIYVDGVRVTRA
jgi:hypothetical protein